MDKQERDRLREKAEHEIAIYGQDILALLDHIEALEGQVAKAHEVIRVIADPDVFPSYHSQGMGCGLEDRCITDRYEAMQYGWYSLADRVHDEVLVVAEDYMEALTQAGEKVG